ncbi:uncharacterized protein J7T54_008139 [Emericellopsis cladophorae]|uniref:Mso1 N-terminal domain-containing protein n=1 Tax=Emericellopsis cladophorae TaxID=2686198 RepID=A0A9Q0BHR7_9HYPO|nr:uncharacterized protein J7T54_008139 [Emericellopsis cladophorae]KAI6785045.1 hypothetical protein J7T54_008139 [Emericellopsis cladophorae]
MTSWYSNLLTKTSSQISNLRSTLLASEADGDTEDDTHVARVLRNYYTEKGRPFPPWLPPDPKAPPQQSVQPLYAQSGNGPMQQQQQQQQQRAPQPGGGGLSSLWDNNGGQQQQQQVPQSLRAGGGGRGGGGQPGLMQRLDDRPSPGSRAGSIHSVHSTSNVSLAPSPSGGGGSSAQDRLKQRLWGARSGSPQQGAQSAYQAPPAGASGGYDDRGSGGAPHMSANAPWSNGDDYSGGGGGGGRSGLPSAGRRQGLPSNPRGYR